MQKHTSISLKVRRRIVARLCIQTCLFLGSLLPSLRGDCEPLWITEGALTSQATALVHSMQNAKEFGLEPSDYAIDESVAGSTVKEDANGKLTAAAIRFVKDLHFGRVEPQAAGFHFPASPNSFDVRQAVQQLSSAADVPATLATLEPHARPYWLLIAALTRYRELAQRPDLISLPPLPRDRIGLGMTYEGAPALRRLLVAFGDLGEGIGEADSIVLDNALEAALKNFQARHGIAADGVLGRQTYAELLVPLFVRVRQIELALERWRWTTSLERPDIVINVPQFMLYALPRRTDAAGTVLEIPVIVGQSAIERQTPIFTAQLRRVIFQPYWDVPDSILHKELLPLIRKDPRYLEKHAMEIVSGARDDSPVLSNTPESITALAAGKARLRQRPGPQNALGSVKFVLPNAYNVYLHGTPEQALFVESRRDFSHGCVRVSDPAALAEYVLANADELWDIDAIHNAMRGSKQIRVDLKQPLRVLFFYSTAAATQSQGVLFAHDVYGQDAKLEALLRARVKERTPRDSPAR